MLCTVTSKDKHPQLQPLKRTLHVTSLLQCPHRGRDISASFHWPGIPAGAQKRQVCAAATERHAGTHTGCSWAGAGARTGQHVAGPPRSRLQGTWLLCSHVCCAVFVKAGVCSVWNWDVC